MEFPEESYVPNDVQDSSDNCTESLDSDEIYLPSDVEGIEPYQFEKTITSSDEENRNPSWKQRLVRNYVLHIGLSSGLTGLHCTY